MSKDKTGKRAGVKRQDGESRALGESLGWPIVDIYVDNDISATNRKKERPEYKRMLGDIKSGRINAIITWHPDRLYRTVRDLGPLTDICKQQNTQIATCKAGDIDLTTPTGRYFAGQLALMGTYEVEHAAERWQLSLQQQREDGTFPKTGSRLFGYTKKGKVDKDEAEIARRMAADLIAGVPITTIARWLDEEGITSTKGTPWNHTTIRRYLANPRIAGWSTLRGEIVGDGNWKPIFDREQWEVIRAHAAEVQLTTPAPPPRVAVLNGMIFCGLCKSPLVTGGRAQRRTGGRVRIYRCHTRPGYQWCGKIGIDAVPTEEVVEAYARKVIRDEPAVAQRRQQIEAEPGPAAAELVQTQERILELEQQLSRPGVSVEMLLQAITRARERQEDLMAQIAARPLSSFAERDRAAWPPQLRARRTLIEQAVRRVEVLPASKPSRLGFDPERIVIDDR
ncbi:recombinase family protein [Nocardioides speluncae]|uniref:recombinase family protein n=1 Tax=Nocardioides speluncae TaxID=2670337 RepID=UPI000D688764|nr:recombinase family protein [Nocardioides speluncae]